VLVNFVFLLHAAVAAVLSFALLFFTKPFTIFVVDNLDTANWPTGVVEDVLHAYAQLTAVGFIGIAIVTTLARISGHSTLRRPVLIAMVLLGLTFILVSFLVPVEPLDRGVLWINVLFVLAYLWVWYFRPETL
jgi:hypothetical protein